MVAEPEGPTLSRLASVLTNPTRSDSVQRLVSRLVRGRRLGVRSRRIAGKEYADIGCGPRTHDNFVNIDYQWGPGIDICCDATQGIPLPTSSMKGVYTEHCLEHLELEGADAVLADIFRVLAPGGTVRIIVPDAELYARRYVDHLDGRSEERFPHDDVDGIHGIRTAAMSVNRIYTMWGHRFIWDFVTLQRVLEHHGFVDVERVAYRQGRDPALLHDDEFHVAESLYVEARRPA